MEKDSKRWKQSVCLGLMILTLLTAITPSFALAQESREISNTLPTALLDFQNKEKKLEETVPKVNSLLTAFLSSQDGVELVERAELEKALSEHELGLSGTVSADSAARIGFLTGAKVLVTGKLFSVENELFLVAKIISTETGRMYAETERALLTNSPADATERLAGKIAKTIADHGDLLVAKKQDSGDLIAALRSKLEGKTLPRISVNVREESIGRASLDPAVETELALILQQVGFEVVDREKTAQMPAIEVTGEAFSETGMTKGNLVSSKARVEIKAVERTSGKLLAVDRQTEAAVDLSEEIAGKNALQSAARKIAERIIPKLVQ